MAAKPLLGAFWVSWEPSGGPYPPGMAPGMAVKNGCKTAPGNLLGAPTPGNACKTAPGSLLGPSYPPGKVVKPFLGAFWGPLPLGMAVKPLLVAFSALLPAWNGCKTVPGSLLGPLGHLGPNAVEMLGPYPPEIATQRLLGAFWRYLPPWNGCKIAFCRPLPSYRRAHVPGPKPVSRP